MFLLQHVLRTEYSALRLQIPDALHRAAVRSTSREIAFCMDDRGSPLGYKSVICTGYYVQIY